MCGYVKLCTLSCQQNVSWQSKNMKSSLIPFKSYMNLFIQSGHDLVQHDELCYAKEYYELNSVLHKIQNWLSSNRRAISQQLHNLLYCSGRWLWSFSLNISFNCLKHWRRLNDYFNIWHYSKSSEFVIHLSWALIYLIKQWTGRDFIFPILLHLDDG